ncbi:MAG: hypothetical protein JSV93_00925 [Candidatus Omnitrophota bacterium]|nr:MAG: hypothetical protein JSV93_00925 [Candidatus Omnitrophota bacterium]
MFSIIPFFILIVFLYFVFSLRYYYTREYLFDPFLQNQFKQFKNQSIDKNDNTFRIICLGGSTTGNFALPVEKRYPNTLHRILQNYYPSVDIEVLNAGTNWYTTKHSLISYVTYYEDWNPDLIIVMHAINDLARSFSPVDFAMGEYNDLWTHFYGSAINAAKSPTFEQHILRYFETPLNAWYSKLRFLERDYSVKRYISLPAFKKNLTKLVKYIKNNKSDIILVTQPSLYKEDMREDELRLLYFGRTISNMRLNFIQREYPSPQSFCQAMKLFNKTVKEVSSKEGVILIDADNAVSKDLRNFRDDVHYTERGAETLAEIIAEKIIDERLILP